MLDPCSRNTFNSICSSDVNIGDGFSREHSRRFADLGS
jgi:hypothetical protein